MAIYDDYLNSNNLYSRPSELMSDVNDYFGANKASLPQDGSTLGDMMGRSSDAGDIDEGHKAYSFGSGQIMGGHTPGENIYGHDTDLLGDFVKKISSLSTGHQKLLLNFIGDSEGDNKAGVSPSEWAKLFGLDEEYANRFQGFPSLLDFTDQIRNVFAGGEQKRGHEMRAAQEAMIQSRRQPRSQGLRMGGMSNEMQRRQMQSTLSQRLSSVKEDTAGKYAQIVSALNNSINRGWSIAGGILDMNPDAGDDDRVDRDTGDIVVYGQEDGLTDRDTSRTTRRGKTRTTRTGGGTTGGSHGGGGGGSGQTLWNRNAFIT